MELFSDFFLMIEQQLQNKAVLALPLCYLSGMLLSFTPCSLPLIPVILGIAGVETNTSRRSAFIVSSIFVLGLVFINVILGLLAVWAGIFFGTIAKLFIVRLVFALFFIVLGLATMEVLQFNLNINLNVDPKRFGLLGTFILGVICGVSVTGCMLPVLGAVLLIVAEKGDFIFGASALALFSLGMGTVYLLFVVLGREFLISLKAKMGLFIFIKKLLGVIIIGIGFYFLKGLL